MLSVPLLKPSEATRKERESTTIFFTNFSQWTHCLHSDSSIDLFSTFIHFHTIFVLLKVNSSDPIRYDPRVSSTKCEVYGNVKSARTRHSKLGSNHQWIQSKWTSWGQGRMEVVTKWSPSGHHRLKHDCYPSCPYFTPLFHFTLSFSHFYPFFFSFLSNCSHVTPSFLHLYPIW